MLKRSPCALLVVIGVVMVAPDWAAAEAMKLIPSHPLAKILRSPAPTAAADAVLRLDAAPAETVSGQAVLLTGDAADVVTAALSDLHHADSGAKIAATAATLQWVRYIELTANTNGVPADELVARAPTQIPDPFWEDAERAVEPNMLQPLWIELAVPADAAAGEYRGTLTVAGRNSRAELPVSLRVRAFRLPDARHQSVIQWWDFPGRGFELERGTDAYWEHLRRSCAFLHRHRQTDVWFSWGWIPQTTDADGKTAWDTGIFERFAEIAFEAGMRAVHLTGLGRYTKHQLEPDARTTSEQASLDRLAAVQAAVVRRGWKGRIFTALTDEPFIYQEQSYRTLVDRVRELAPDVGMIEAIETEYVGDLDIVVPKLSHLNLWWPYYEALKRQGREVWFYTCCHPQGRYPNRFLDQPLVKARVLHWIGYLYGLDGFLHWGLNWFAKTGDPYTEKGAKAWDGLPPGDSQVAYPGTKGFLGSLRLSAMRDGLQDYEYLWTLEDRLRELKQRLGDEAHWLDPRQRSLELCRRVVQSFYEHTRDPQVLLATRAAVADEIEALAASPLLVVQTSPPEGTVLPLGPIMVNVRGVTTPGAKVTVNGRTVIAENISPNGCFFDAQFLTAETPAITVTAELEDRSRTVARTFQIVE